MHVPFPLRFLPPHSSDHEVTGAHAGTPLRWTEEGAGRGAMSSGDEPVVVGVAADPEPQEAVVNLHAQCSVGQPDANGSETVDLHEVLRGMLRVAFQ